MKSGRFHSIIRLKAELLLVILLVPRQSQQWQIISELIMTQTTINKDKTFTKFKNGFAYLDKKAIIKMVF
jgi:hypothetical protein